MSLSDSDADYAAECQVLVEMSISYDSLTLIQVLLLLSMIHRAREASRQRNQRHDQSRGQLE